jgi:hypothetical protein
MKETLQELMDSFTKLAEEADGRKKLASKKNENYKLEFADGEKHANEDAAKRIKAILVKI